MAGRHRSIVGAIGSALVVLALFAVSAQAEWVRPLLLSETLPEERTPLSVAVNQTTHHLYVTNVGATGIEPRVSNYEENGQIDLLEPELTGARLFRPSRVAVDNSGATYAGYVYADGDTLYELEKQLYPGEWVVQQFDTTGKATGVRMTDSSVPANGTAQGDGLPPVVNLGEWTPGALAVSSSGEVFVVDETSRLIPGTGKYERADVIDVFSSTGAFVKQLALGKGVGPGTNAIALDRSGNIYVGNQWSPVGSPFSAASPPEGAGLFELSGTTGECVRVGCAPITTEKVPGVAIDNTAKKIYTTGLISYNNGDEGKVSEYEMGSGKLLGVTHPKSLHSPHGVAVDESSGEVVVADALPEREGTIDLFGSVEVVPDVMTLAPEEVTDGSVLLRGEVGAAGLSDTTCVFQYVDEERFKENGFEGAAEAACAPAGPFSGTTMNAVQADVQGLRGGTVYHERIVGKTVGGGENGSNPGEEGTFETAGPTVGGSEVTEVGETVATLKGTVDPRGAATSYRFQYVSQTEYEANGWAQAIDMPVGGEAIGDGSAAVPVSARVSALAPGVGYRFRIAAVSAGGASHDETDGEEVVFATYALVSSFTGCPNESLRDGGLSGGLPDCRAYEQVTPTDKNGANIQGASDAVQASLTGDRVTFFVNTGIPGGEGEQQFPTYLASRSPGGDGWSSQGLLPSASYGPQAHVLGWTEGLEDVYDFAAPAFEPGKLLLRHNTDGSMTEVGTVNSKSEAVVFAGSSREGMVALLESQRGGLLPGDLAGKQNVYVYDRTNGRLVLAGVMNDGVTVPGEGVAAGSYDWFVTKNTKTYGGAYGSYFTQAQHAVSEDGKKVFFTAKGTGQIYVRVNPFAEPEELGAQACLKGVKACTVRISAPEAGVTDPGTPAAFVDASADGRFVYFLDNGKLTKDATGGAGYDLYRYDTQTGALTDLTLDTVDKKGAGVEGMLSVGESGEDAYFAADGKLTADAQQAPYGETNLYELHGTTVSYITRLVSEQSGGGEGDTADWTPGVKIGTIFSQTIPHESRVSADGRTLLFASTRRLTGYDNHDVRELYMYRTGQGLSCVSCNPTGEAPAGQSGVQEIPTPTFSLSHNYQFMTRNLSADGRRVIFDSADRLVAADENNVNDVYEWEAKSEGSCNVETVAGGCLFLLSSGAANAQPSYFGDADSEGENVFVFTAQSLVAQDKDKLYDVYDTRADGGIASQDTVEGEPCGSVEGCRSPLLEAPAVFSVASAEFHGSGDLVGKPDEVSTTKNPVKCRKGFVRKHGKCVRGRKAEKKRKRHGAHKRRKKQRRQKHVGKSKRGIGRGVRVKGGGR